MKKYVFGLIGLFLLLTSCEDSIFWRLQDDDRELLVVDAILTNEFKQQEILLSLNRSRINGPFFPLSDAIVWVKANGVRFDFSFDSTGGGIYRSNAPFSVVDNLDYELKVEWEGVAYAASSQLSEVGPIPGLVFSSASNDDSLVSLQPIGNIFDPNQDAMYEVDIDWSHLSGNDSSQARLLFYSFSSLHINELIRPRKEAVSFPQGSVVVVKKFGLNPDFAEFLRTLLIETEWNGNFYYSNASNLPTNITPEALGFFSTCAVLSDTVVASL